YYELFVKHYPWGRPGGGAPNLDIRRKDITAVGLHSTPTISTMHRLNSWQPCRYNDYFSQRKKCHDPATCYHHHLHHHIPPLPPPPPPHVTTHTHTVQTTTEACHPGSVLALCERSAGGDVGVGAKLGATNTNAAASSSGGIGVGLGATKNGETLHITLKDHPSMSFRNKGHLDIEVRYKPGAAAAGGKGKPLLEKIVVSDSDKCPLAQGIHAQPALRGSPRKKKLIAKLEKPPSKDPWGKAGPGGKPWRSPKTVGSSFMKSLGWTNKEMLKDLDQDNPVTPAEKPTFRKVRTNKKVQRCCDLCICSCPGIVTNKGCGGIAMATRKKPHQSSPSKGQSNTTTTNPTAPATTTAAALKQKYCPRFVRHCGATMDNNNSNNTETSANVGGEGVELVPLLARRRANTRPVSLSSTDVTKRTASKDRYACNMINRSKYMQHLQQLHCNNISHSHSHSHSHSNNININNMNNNNSNSISKCKNKRIIANKICNFSNAIIGNCHNSNQNNSNNSNENSSSGTSCCLKKFTLHIR
ncbi:PREDICTED: homeobox protein 2-like, partial [Rhagoletis zephyria]|uniref:homeobox protein 2-like n=1 Tax=Rhagoletis zephyria TaxID=28612 RepID=UPI00081161E3